MTQVSTSRPVSAARRVTDSRMFERLARAGYVMAGLVHLLIGYLAVRLAFGGGGTTDQSGAMAELAAKPGGVPALVVGIAAFVFMALWRLTEAVLGSRTHGDEDRKSDLFHRGKAFAVALVYFGYAITAFGFVQGSGSSSGGKNAGLSARMMQSTGGKIAIVLVGVVIIGVGAYHIYKGATRRFLKELRTDRALLRRLGTVGYLSKGSAIAGVGVLVIVAVFQSDPGKASGLDAALKTLGAQPFGPVLLVTAGLGIAAYGLYDFACARYARM
ncbi:DUF1206 domain-containing protein [Nocardia zapadnayensis]|uniref:DUF1206 domain-containing protein n=1 Tax=Nocardia rhamnosiphila TaxID=426716 RepID=UPI0022465498|nr:DUF1206 domain-containing protein [Nocardia zapadnayensis]MCX0273425.1 DUF1206 domain-containing protein [Nocardia zapadnayensis]